MRKYAILILVLAIAPLHSQTAEEQFKAALILSFARFSDWPSELKKVNLCIVADGTKFSHLVAKVGQAARAGTKPIETVLIAKAAEVADCQLLAVPEAVPAGQVAGYLAAAKAAQVLTIGENKKFLALGGAVRLFLEDGQLRFEASVGALQDTSIAVSTKLLRLGYLRKDGK